MKPKVQILHRIVNQGVLPLFYHDDFETSLEIISAMYRAGIRVVEYTNRGNAATRNFCLLKKKISECFPEMLLGIGTIKTVDDAKRFIEAGANFIVSPLVDPQLSAYLNKEDLLWIPGAMTPTEIFNAQSWGALLIKIFPANVVGAGFLSSIREVFPGQLFMVTGGVELDMENLKMWFRSGASLVGMGSKLITKEILENKDYQLLYQRTKEILSLINIVRS